jgi:hypothetical protein
VSRPEGGDSAEPPSEAQPPAETGTPADFTTALRALRTWSGLTYRQLEGKARASGRALPASTTATTLGRTTLPREPFVEAFTRACGLGDDEVARWIDVRRRIALQDQAPPTESAPADDAPRFRRRPRLWPAVVLSAFGAGILGTLGVQALWSGAGTPHPAPDPVPGLPILAVGSWAQIHPARARDLCVTEGRDRTRRYATAVAAQHSCAQATLPRTFIEPLGAGAVQIQWHHPEHGVGCLTVLLDGAGRDLVEPRDDCAEDDAAQRFGLEPVGPPAAAHFRLRPAATAQCLSLRDQDTADGTEIVQGRCSGAADQEFLIDLIPPA